MSMLAARQRANAPGLDDTQGGVAMAKATCSFKGCDKPARTRGWCPKHYTRWWKHGDPSIRLPMGPPPGSRQTPVEPRFWAKVNKTEGCWLWTGGTAGEGYAMFSPRHGQQVYAYRFAWELLVGPIPEGHEIDHVRDRGCTSRLCVKAIADEHGPAHLEPVTGEENRRRAHAANARTHCPKGHIKDGIRAGRPYCLTCNRERAKAWREIHPGRGGKGKARTRKER